MDLKITPGSGNPLDPYGLGEFLRRFQETLATGDEPLGGFTFTNDSREMLALSRTIENSLSASAEGATLYVGFQNAGKLTPEVSRYDRLRQSGVTVVAFGEGQPLPEDLPRIDSWTTLERNTVALENQWFLISPMPTPIAFIGWEVSPDDLWGRYGLSMAGKQFTGFISDDERLVVALSAHLEEIRARFPRSGASPTDTAASLIRRLRPQKVLVLADAGRLDFIHRAHADVIEGCRDVGALLAFYDVSAASYLVNPYPDDDTNRWTIDSRSRPDVNVSHLLMPNALRGLGRTYLAQQVESTIAAGVEARGILPYGVGFAHLGLWCQSEAIDLVVIPAEYTRPSLSRRLQGLTLEKLQQSATVQVVVDDPARGAWVARALRTGQGRKPVIVGSAT